jgi:hypothetical protein
MASAIDPPSAAPSAAAPAAMPNLRVATFDDYPQIARLESENNLLSLPQRDWCALWMEHPMSARLPSGFPIGWVLESPEGQVVGAMANIPAEYLLNGDSLIAATGRGWVVSAAYRGYAVWIMDEYFNQPNIDLFINTTVNALAVDAFAAFGSKRTPLGDWTQAAYWVTNHHGFARTALRIKHAPAAGLLAFPAGVGLRLKDAVSTRFPPDDRAGLEIAFTETFDDRFDAFWKQLKIEKSRLLLKVRDRQSFAWHFSGPLRTGKLWILTASSHGLLRAYAIFKSQDHPPSGLIRMRLVDYQSLDGCDALGAMINVALARCARETIHTLEHVGCALPKMKLFDTFAPYRRALPAWPYYFKADDPRIDEQLADPSRWDSSAFDGDTSL